MKHYLLIKFETGYYSDQIFQNVKEMFDRIEKEIEAVNDVKVRQNCYKREENMDLMIEFNVEDDALDTYINHELHQKFVKRFGPHIIQKVTFDNK